MGNKINIYEKVLILNADKRVRNQTETFLDEKPYTHDVLLAPGSI